jgi:hypothetical protein
MAPMMGFGSMRKAGGIVLVLFLMFLSISLQVDRVHATAYITNPKVSSATYVHESQIYNTVSVHGELAGAFDVSFWDWFMYHTGSSITITFYVEVWKDIAYWPDEKIGSNHFDHTLTYDLYSGEYNIYRAEWGDTETTSDENQVSYLMRTLDAYLALSGLYRDYRVYCKIQAYLPSTFFGGYYTAWAQPSDSQHVDLYTEPWINGMPTVQSARNVGDTWSRGWTFRQTGSDTSPDVYLTISMSDGVEYDSYTSPSNTQVNVYESPAGSTIWTRWGTQITAQYKLVDFEVTSLAPNTDVMISVTFRATAAGDAWYRYHLAGECNYKGGGASGAWVGSGQVGLDSGWDQQGWDSKQVSFSIANPPPPTRILTTGVSSGSGTVSPSYPGGNQEQVGSDEKVYAYPLDSSWSFSGWSPSGVSCIDGSSISPCHFTMPNNDVSVYASFTQNQPPSLSNGYVTPLSGDTSTTFTYYVDYHDPEGAAPTTKTVWIDGGNGFYMSLYSGSASSGTYYYQSTGYLWVGSHNFHFQFSDGVNTVYLPSSGSSPGPTVGTPPTPALGSAIRLSANIGISELPSVAASGSQVYVAWADDTPVSGSGGSYEVWLRASSNYGASFGSPIRISTNTGTSDDPSVAAIGSYAYVAWQDSTPVPGSGGWTEIWLRVSSNSGVSFGSPIRISSNAYASLYPSVAASGSNVYVAWEDATPVSGSGTGYEVWMRVSSNNGASFGSAIRISWNTYDSVSPSVAASGSYVYVAWEDYTPVAGSGTQPEIWLRISSNSGVSFGSAIRMSTNIGSSANPSIAASGSYVYIAWQDSTPVPGSGDNRPEIWMRVSSNYGASLGSAIRMSTNAGNSYNPSVAADGSHVYVAWQDDTPVTGSGTGYEVWLRASSNNGATFNSPIRISTNTYDSVSPSVAASGSYVYVAWEDYTPVAGSGGEPEIWMRVSANSGTSFGSPVRLSSNAYMSLYPSVAASGNYVYVVWQDHTPVVGSGGAPEVWMRVSSNNGAVFGSAVRMSTNTGYSDYPHVAASGSNVYVTWQDNTPVTGSGGDFEVWLRASSNNGATFGSAIRITTNTGSSVYPTVAASGSVAYVAWEDSTPVSGSGTAPEIWLRVGG